MYSFQEVERIFSMVNMPNADQDDCIDMTPELLASWIMAMRTNGTVYVVTGFKAMLSLTATSWFVECFDVTKSDPKVGWWGSIFGADVFVVPELLCPKHRLESDCLYVISADGGHGVSQLLR